MLPTLLPLLLLAALAGLVRGFSGFGYAVIMGLGLAWVLPVPQAVATALLLDLVCVLGALPWAWRHREPALLASLLLGMVLSLPAGVWLLQALPASGLHLMAGVIALLGGLMLLTRWQLPGGMPRLAFPVGMASGLAMTCASAGGPPLMYYLLNQPCRPETQRATAILFFACSSLLSLLALGGGDLLGEDWLTLAAQLWLPSLLGDRVGAWLFRRHGTTSLRRWSALLLILLAFGVLLHPAP